MHRTLIALSVAAATALVGAPATAVAGPQCGDTITASTTLTKDLTCTGDALTVIAGPGAGHIVLNFNGHSITGPGLASTPWHTAIVTDDTSGDPASSIDLVGGTITGFGSALISVNGNSGGPQNLTVRRMTFTDNYQWSARGVAGQYRVQNSRFTNSGNGGVRSGGHLTVTNSTFVNSSVGSTSSSSTSVYGSSFTGASITTGGDSDLTVVGTTIRNCNYGLDLSGVRAASIRGNRIEGCNRGIRLTGSRQASVIEGNQILNSAFIGMEYTAGVEPITIIGNTFNKSGSDGLTGTGSGVTITSNTAEKNGSLGISVTDATDGGGNVARKNTDPRQCTGVVCSS